MAVGTRGCREDRVMVETERHLEASALIQMRNDGGLYQGHSQGGGEECCRGVALGRRSE